MGLPLQSATPRIGAFQLASLSKSQTPSKKQVQQPHARLSRKRNSFFSSSKKDSAENSISTTKAFPPSPPNKNSRKPPLKQHVLKQNTQHQPQKTHVPPKKGVKKNINVKNMKPCLTFRPPKASILPPERRPGRWRCQPWTAPGLPGALARWRTPGPVWAVSNGQLSTLIDTHQGLGWHAPTLQALEAQPFGFPFKQPEKGTPKKSELSLWEEPEAALSPPEDQQKTASDS